METFKSMPNRNDSKSMSQLTNKVHSSTFIIKLACIYLSKKNNVIGIVSRWPLRGQLSYKETMKRLTLCLLG